MEGFLPDEFFKQLTKFLVTFMHPDERETWISQAFFLRDRNLFDRIDLEGAPLHFTTKLIITLLKIPTVEPVNHPITLLLDTIGEHTGLQHQNEIAYLKSSFQQVCKLQSLEINESLSSNLSPIKAPSYKPTVFLSFMMQDIEVAKEIAAELEKAGYNCRLLSSTMKGSEEWIRLITNEINRSDAVVSVVTENSLRDKWFKFEYVWARLKKRLILPILTSDRNVVPKYMSEVQLFSLREEREAEFANLVHTLPSPVVLVPSADLDYARTIMRMLESESALDSTVTKRSAELAYLETLQFEEFLNSQKYTDLSGTVHKRAAITLKQEFLYAPWRSGNTAQSEERIVEGILSKIFELRRVIVIGDPGCGKSTTLWQVAKDMADRAILNFKEPIPLLLRLNKWTDERQSFNQFAMTEIYQLSTFFDELLEERRIALLLDGINEIPSGQRLNKISQLCEFVREHIHLTTVITCRTQDQTFLDDLKFDIIRILPLNTLQISDFMSKYLPQLKAQKLFWEVAGDDSKKLFERFKQAFSPIIDGWEEVFWLATALPAEISWGVDNQIWNNWFNMREHPRSLLTFAKNPYLLQMLVDVYDYYLGKVPSNRGDLFNQFISVILLRESLATYNAELQKIITGIEADQLLMGLANIAYEMYRNKPKKRENIVASIPLEYARRFLTDNQIYQASCASILQVGEKVTFTHQLLQEYFAALNMKEQISKGELKAEKIWRTEKWWDYTGWEEVATLLAGLFNDDCTPIIEWIEKANPEVAAKCILDCGAGISSQTLIQLQKKWLKRLKDEPLEAPPRARAALGRALGILNLDNREGVGVDANGNPNIKWIRINDIKGRKSGINKPQTFYISQFPITYAQYEAFVNRRGYVKDCYWTNAGLNWRKQQDKPGYGWKDPIWHISNHPVIGITWYEAVAFCNWLSEILGSAISLPTEAQWQEAGGWSEKQKYPWGPDYLPKLCNVNDKGESYIGRTTAVGTYSKKSASPNDIYDMSGNVSEWCLNDFHKPNIIELEGNASRVLHGGSWYQGTDLITLSARLRDYPFDRSAFIGFRVVKIDPN
jgi:hypothetical protein